MSAAEDPKSTGSKPVNPKSTGLKSPDLISGDPETRGTKTGGKTGGTDAGDHGTARPGKVPSLGFRVAALSQKKPTRFDFAPDPDERATLAAVLGLLDLPALRLKGEMRPAGRRDVVMEARLTATAIQPCVVTLAPVAAEIDEPVLRRYLDDFAQPSGDETEIPEDDSAEPLPELIDVAEVAAEALALALPLYPRAPGVELGEAVFAAEGAEPLRDADLKPFAGLAALADRLKSPPDGGA